MDESGFDQIDPDNERKRNLDILSSIVGTSEDKKDNKSKKNLFKDPSQLR